MKTNINTLLICLLMVSASAWAQDQNFNTLTFANGNLLFAGNSKTGAIHAFELPPAPAKPSQAYVIKDLDSRIATFLKVKTSDFAIKDMVVRPGTSEAYLAVDIYSSGSGRLLKLDQSGKVEDVALKNLKQSKIQLQNIPANDVKLWKTIPARSFTITDMDFFNNELYVSGLSNAEFSSTLYRVKYPFDAKISTSVIEMYHAVHNQKETRAPIRTLSIMNIEGEPAVLAAYTCTPLVIIPAKDLEDKKMVTGKTIAELGYGNTPIDMLQFSYGWGDQPKEDYVLITNKARSAMLLTLKDIVAGSKIPGLSTPVNFPLKTESGVRAVSIPINSVLQIDNQDDQYFAVLRRDVQSGAIELVSVRKGAYFRLSDFENEYDFASYRYPKNDAYTDQVIKPIHKLFRAEEGFEELAEHGSEQQ